jgi:hypothetical protein
MVSGPPRSATSAGTRSTSPALCSTSAGSRTASRAPTDPGRRAAGAAPAAPGEPVIALRLRRRARLAVHHGRLCQPHRLPLPAPPGAEGAPAHAAPRLRLRPRQQGARHPGDSGLAGHRSITSTAVYTALAPNHSKTSGGIEPPPTAHCGAYNATFQEASRHSPAFSRKKACRA